MKQLLLLLLCCCTSFWSSAFDLHEAIANSDTTTNQTFLQSFPYEDYLKSGIFSQPDKLQDDRDQLRKLGFSYDRLVYRLCKFYLKKYPAEIKNFPDLQKKLRTAEMFVFLHKLFPESKVYYAAKDLIFGAVSKTVEGAVVSGAVSVHDPRVQYLVLRLQENHYFLNLPKSSWSKLFFHIKQGNWAYIWDRFLKRYQDYWMELSLCFFVLLLPIGVVVRRRRVRRGRNFANV